MQCGLHASSNISKCRLRFTKHFGPSFHFLKADHLYMQLVGHHRCPLVFGGTLWLLQIPLCPSSCLPGASAACPSPCIKAQGSGIIREGQAWQRRARHDAKGCGVSCEGQECSFTSDKEIRARKPCMACWLPSVYPNQRPCSVRSLSMYSQLLWANYKWFVSKHSLMMCYYASGFVDAVRHKYMYDCTALHNSL